MVIFLVQKELQTYRQDLVCQWILHDNNVRRQTVLECFKLIWAVMMTLVDSLRSLYIV